MLITNETKELLRKQQEIEKLKKREERYSYLGILAEYQLYGKEQLQYKKLNPYQHFLFKRVLHGFNMYTKEEISQLHWDKKRRIKKVWTRGQKVLNLWKQELCNKAVNDWMERIFGDDAKGFWSIPANETLDNYQNILTLKDLGISYEDVILKFIEQGLLPKNFLSLKNETIKKTSKRKSKVQEVKV